jgi:hypothetical protein
MPAIKPPSIIERVAGNVATEAGLTFVGAMIGTPLAALLPVLSKSLASERQRRRVEEALSEIEQTLSEHEAALVTLTDSQYKLLNEAVLSLLHTTSAEKFAYLQRVVRNSLYAHDIIAQEAAVLSRIVRDISATEIEFVVRNFSLSRVWLTTGPNTEPEKVITIDPSSAEAVVVSGLLSQGLLISGSSDYAGLGMLSWSPITAKLLAVLREPAP